MIESLERRQFLSASLTRGILKVTGTAHSETIRVRESGTRLIVAVGSVSSDFTAAKVKKLVIDAGRGDDLVIPDATSSTTTTALALAVTSATVRNTTLLGGSGDDTLIGAAGVDFLNGGAGDDSLDGGSGNDILIGSTGDDTLRGGSGDDSIHGNTGANRALTEDTDDVLDCDLIDPANAFVPIAIEDLGLTITVEATGLRPIATLTFSKVPSSATFKVDWTRHVGNKFYIIANIERSTEDFTAKNASKTVQFDFGKYPVGDYEVDVWSKNGKTPQTQTFTVTK